MWVITIPASDWPIRHAKRVWPNIKTRPLHSLPPNFFYLLAYHSPSSESTNAWFIHHYDLFGLKCNHLGLVSVLGARIVSFLLLTPRTSSLLPQACCQFTMSSPTTTTTLHTANKRNASSLNPKAAPNFQKKIKKVTISYSPSPPPRDDFILFPTPEVIEQHPSDRRARARRVREELISDGLLPSPREDDNASGEKLTPLQRAAKRRNKVEHLPIVHQSDKRSQRGDMKLPPAPSPPRLGTPDLDDIDEDLWSCRSWDESSRESYIAASKRPQGTNLFPFFFSHSVTKSEIHRLTNRQINPRTAEAKHDGRDFLFFLGAKLTFSSNLQM